ncbi:PAS domain S-box-containing protein [Aneurinibacillus soli]|uniref:HTH-type transcriptional regulatory protein TyrR n=1 Tax=Aneurinibacillus soli TaxID=1500254 RepID=A0A0U5AWP9_9BACL|nr:sigma 54-interacting transcriptional regulator [Aneurinibacillus soli]PYE58793.1 PAS domain S-box-containing protein [Aneurinibacillus soli]BAU26658.1 Limonene hydroxylase [Aneurinibacillus soli]
MVKWKEILHPIPILAARDCTIRQAIQRCQHAQEKILFIGDGQTIVGYVDESYLLRQAADASSLDDPVVYCENILVVEEEAVVEFYHNISVVLGKDLSGRYIGFTTIERARHEATGLKLNQLEQIFDGAGIGIVTTDEQSRITFLNEQAAEIFGMPQDVLLYRKYETLLSAEKQMNAVLSGKQLVSVSNYFNSRHIIGNFSPLYQSGQVVGSVHLFYLQEHLEEAVRELKFVRNLNEDLQAIYTSANEQIVVVNEHGVVIRLSGTFSREFWLVHGPEAVIGQSIYELGQQGIFPTDIVTNCCRQKQKVMHVQTMKSGRKIWAVGVPVWQRKRIEKVVIVLRDITELNEYQMEHADDFGPENEKQPMKSLIYRSKAMETIVDQVKMIAEVNSTVLLLGESGVGKEVFAQTIHDHSLRRDKPFIRVNCGAIPENLIESEFFGYESGAFTGADRKGRAGLFEAAHEGTIFLDEVAELPMNLQVKLLRVLQEKEVRRVGGTHSIPVDVRVIAATNKDLKQKVREQTFREDLYYRLHVIPVRIPPLRERAIDIIPLSLYFLEQFSTMYGKEKQLSRQAVEVLETYQWPGNVRELQNVIERLVVTTRGLFVEEKDALATLYGETDEEQTIEPMIMHIRPLKDALEQVENELLSLALRKYETASDAARVLGVSEATMSRKIKKYFPFGRE